MRKIISLLLSLILITGCSNLMNTPIKRVEELLYKYQSLDSSVVLELETTVNKFVELTTQEQELYIDAIKRQYSSLTYDIKDEVIDGNIAEVIVIIEVYDYNSAIKEIINNQDYDASLLTQLQLENMLSYSKKITYQLTIYLTKINDIWEIDGLVDIDKQKLMGIYDN